MKGQLIAIFSCPDRKLAEQLTVAFCTANNIHVSIVPKLLKTWDTIDVYTRKNRSAELKSVISGNASKWAEDIESW